MYTNNSSSPRDLSKIEKPAVSVTVLIFTINKGKLEVALIKRVRKPFDGYWSLPGDILSIETDLEDAARKVLQEKTGIKNVYLEQLYTFGNPERDPRGRVITVAYFALLPHNSFDLDKTTSTIHAKWISVNNLPKDVAFDHEEIISYGVERLKNKVEYSNIAHGLLPDKFRLSDLQKIYEIILNKKLDKRNFRKRMTSLKLVEPTKEIYKLGNHRPALLYKFSTKQLMTFN
jgi:8-oxo-dGTP diphosphatase